MKQACVNDIRINPKRLRALYLKNLLISLVWYTEVIQKYYSHYKKKASPLAKKED